MARAVSRADRQVVPERYRSLPPCTGGTGTYFTARSDFPVDRVKVKVQATHVPTVDSDACDGLVVRPWPGSR